MFIIFALHLLLDCVSKILGQIIFHIFKLSGKLLQNIIVFTESFYSRNEKYKEKLLLTFLLYRKNLSVSSHSVRLLKSQLKNTGYKKYYSFFQKLYSIFIYLVFMPDKEKINQYLSHKLRTIINYISKLKKNGLFSLFTRPQYKRVPHNKINIDIVRLIWDIHDHNETWGRFKIAYYLFKLGMVVSPSTVRNYLNQPRPPKRFLRKARKKKQDTVYTGKNRIKAKYTNHIWNADMTCVRILFIYVYVYFMMDIYSRKVFYGGISLWNPNTEWIIKKTKMQVNCLDFKEPPKHIITDNGEQFISPRFEVFCKSYGIAHRTGKIGSPKSTAKIERFFQTIKYESLNYIPFISKKELVDIIYSFLNYYNNYRPHSSLFGFTPNMVYEGIKQEDLKTKGKVIKKRKFCKGLITAYYLEKAA